MVSKENPSDFWSRERLDELILEIIESVLKSILGEGSAKVITLYAKKSDGWEDIHKRVEVYVDALRKILGPPSLSIEILILKSLFSKLELRFEEKEGYKFLDYIKELQNSKFDWKNTYI